MPSGPQAPSCLLFWLMKLGCGASGAPFIQHITARVNLSHAQHCGLLAKATELSLAQGVDLIDISQYCLQSSNNVSWEGCGWEGCGSVIVASTPHIVSCPDPTHSHEEKGLVLFEQFLGLSSEFWEANQNRSM